jgi:phage terminase large subunit-like protein
MQRLNLVAPIIKRGLVYVPESLNKPGMARDWVNPLISQLCAFPEVRHDDLVDATTQALRLLRDQGFLVLDYVYNDSDQYVDETQPRRVNPYAL